MTDWIRSAHGSIKDIAIAEIILDDDLQPRCGIDAVLVGEYVDALVGGATFPPVVVFREGTRLYLADGFHRLKAHQSLGKAEILCAVSAGSRTDALRYSLSANAAHGRPRTGGDMARAYRAAKKAGHSRAG